MAARQWRRLHPKKRYLPKPYAPTFPVSIEREYGRDLADVIASIDNAMKAIILPALPGLLASRHEFRAKRDADDMDSIHEMWRRVGLMVEEDYTDDELKSIALARGSETSDWNKKTISKNLKKVIGLDPLFGDAGVRKEMQLFAITNVNLIESLRDDTIKKLETQMLVDFQQGLRAEEIAKRLEEYVDPKVGTARARANLIARDQIGKLNGQLTQIRQEEIGVESYTWRTMGDARVRDEHQELADQVFRWDDPPSVGHPGDDYQCRCYAEPVLSEYVN